MSRRARGPPRRPGTPMGRNTPRGSPRARAGRRGSRARSERSEAIAAIVDPVFSSCDSGKGILSTDRNFVEPARRVVRWHAKKPPRNASIRSRAYSTTSDRGIATAQIGRFACRDRGPRLESRGFAKTAETPAQTGSGEERRMQQAREYSCARAIWACKARPTVRAGRPESPVLIFFSIQPCARGHSPPSHSPQ